MKIHLFTDLTASNNKYIGLVLWIVVLLFWLSQDNFLDEVSDNRCEFSSLITGKDEFVKGVLFNDVEASKFILLLILLLLLLWIGILILVLILEMILELELDISKEDSGNLLLETEEGLEIVESKAVLLLFSLLSSLTLIPLFTSK